jgi:hypothetical protein
MRLFLIPSKANAMLFNSSISSFLSDLPFGMMPTNYKTSNRMLVSDSTHGVGGVESNTCVYCSFNSSDLTRSQFDFVILNKLGSRHAGRGL